MTKSIARLVSIPCEPVLFAHGGGSSRLSVHNHFLASVLRRAEIGTFIFDLLTEQDNVFDFDFLAQRLLLGTRYLRKSGKFREGPLGYFGASTGTPAALLASVLGGGISAIVSRGGAPDLAHRCLDRVTTPTLLIVGGQDIPVVVSNRKAYNILKCEKALEVVPGAGHHFDESGALEKVGELAIKWFTRYFSKQLKSLSS